MDPIRVVIIGFAHMHVNEIVQYILAEPDVLLVGMADLPPLHPERNAARYTRGWNLKNNSELTGLTPYADYRQMLDEKKPALAFILCENSRKPEVVEECARRGVNVSIEKPMAVDLQSALQIEKSVRRHGIEAMVNWPVIWRPYIHRELAALASGVAGKLMKAYYINGNTGPLGRGVRHRGVNAVAEEMTDEERAATWWYHAETGGGAFLDIGCYGCFFNEWVRADDDRPLSVMAFAGNYCHPYMDAPDNMAGIIEYRDSYGVVEGTWTTPQAYLPTGPIFACTEGAIYCTAEREVRAMNFYGNEILLPDFAPPPHIANIVDHYADCKRTGRPLLRPVTLEFNLRLMHLIDAALRSADSGRREPVR